MANNFTASFEEVWGREQQEVFYKKNLAMEMADSSHNSAMSKGDTLNRTYRSSVSVQAYTRGSEITIDDNSDTNEQLTVNREFATGMYIDNFDQIQGKYNIAANYGKDYGEALANQVDADVLGEVVNADSALSAVTLSTSNVLAMFSGAKKELRRNNISSNNLSAIISPDVESILIQYGAGRDTSMGDRINKEGYFGKFQGFECYVSNQLAGSAVLGLATQPTDGDTITVDGITFTFVSTIGTTAGNVLIGANVDATRASLAALIAAPSTTTATGVALSETNARKVANTWTGTDDATADTLSFVCNGVGVLEVSTDLTDETDAFSSILQHNVFGVSKKMTTLVMQSSPKVQAKEVPNKLGKNMLNSVLYGVKTFGDNAKQMVDAPINAASL